MATKKGKTNLKRTSMASRNCQQQQNDNVVNKKETTAIEFCRVCDVQGVACHYGSVCCSGCKGFFRRSVRFQKIYRCPYEAKCVISKLYRNCCRACRFQKCLSIGLDPNLVHGVWGQTGANFIAPKDGTKMNSAVTEMPSSTISSPYSDSLPNLMPEIAASSPFSASSDSELPTKLIGANALIQQNKILNSEDSLLALGYNNRLKLCIPPIKGATNCAALAEYFIAVECLCDLFVDSSASDSSRAIPPGTSAHPNDWLPKVNLEIPVGMAMKQPGKVSPRFPMNWTPNFLICKTMLQRVYCRLIVHYFDWVSHVPELVELNDEDRQNLIVKRAMRCIWLLCAFRSAALNCQGIVGSCQMIFPYGPAEQEALEPEFKELFSDSVNLAYTKMVVPFRQLAVTEAEYSLIRVLCLFSPVSPLSEQGRQLVLKYQAKYLNALSELVSRNWGKNGAKEPMIRMSRLMLFLSIAEQVAQLDDKAFLMLNVFNLAGMRGTLTYEIHVRAQEKLGGLALRNG